ncbi:hypothetical protein OHA98_41485 [Streptomyces sp. NBC_00654]|uniref:hypothetical protein n=1 Tax=Streptomyces sp. NBC_00654 TaxID=2975799 RepID=UPI002252BA84|nr:hypothetical protein [Streptomyces sp. NBC_00654]MCX4971087.1 hypothetical protein [Streptomyces sp. NBC_00654]
MTILIDTKNEIKTAVSGLTEGVGEVDRELRAAAGAITELRETDLANLKSSQHETRTSAYNAGKRASEAVTAVVDLRRDVERLHHGLTDLRRGHGRSAVTAACRGTGRGRRFGCHAPGAGGRRHSGTGCCAAAGAAAGEPFRVR